MYKSLSSTTVSSIMVSGWSGLWILNIEFNEPDRFRRRVCLNDDAGESFGVVDILGNMV